MSSLDFTIYCGCCSCVVEPNNGGSVLSCGDFLCPSCAPRLISGSSCPSCGRNGVRAVFMNDSLPEEVKMNISDPLNNMEKLHNILAFQIKYYKNIIRKLSTKLHRAEADAVKATATIKELEDRLRQQPQQSQSFFSRGETPVPSRTVAANNTSNFSSTFSSSDSSPFRSTKRTAPMREPESFGSRSFSHQEESSRMNQSPMDADMGWSNHNSTAEIQPERELPGQMRGNSHPAQRVTAVEETYERRRVFTPARTTFPARNTQFQQSHRLSSPRIRSPNEPILTAKNLNPLQGSTRVVEMYRVNHPAEQRNPPYSPMASFLRNEGYR